MLWKSVSALFAAIVAAVPILAATVKLLEYFDVKSPALISFIRDCIDTTIPLWIVVLAIAPFAAIAYCLGRSVDSRSNHINGDASKLNQEFFLGRWQCGHGTGGTGEFIMTLNRDGTVHKSHVPAVSGTWSCVQGAARIHTSDMWRDILRRTPEGVIKFAYNEEPGVLPDSRPTNYSIAEKLPDGQ
jgi:hypothetical protein